MTPEIRRKLENNTTPFGLMEPELQEALRELKHGAKGYKYVGPDWSEYDLKCLWFNDTYRLAPSGLVIPDALWELLDKKWVAIAKTKAGYIFPYESKPKPSNGFWSDATFGPLLDTLFPNLDPYNCDWRNSLAMRPGYED